MTDLATNVLYYGDNLDILHRYLPDAAVDLVDLDPPINSNPDDSVSQAGPCSCVLRDQTAGSFPT
jgi:site-specific DNA-methyltransferase (adenine-specific)